MHTLQPCAAEGRLAGLRSDQTRSQPPSEMNSPFDFLPDVCVWVTGTEGDNDGGWLCAWHGWMWGLLRLCLQANGLVVATSIKRPFCLAIALQRNWQAVSPKAPWQTLDFMNWNVFLIKRQSFVFISAEMLLVYVAVQQLSFTSISHLLHLLWELINVYQ